MDIPILNMRSQARQGHQPTREEPSYEQPSIGELQSAFGESVALVLACDAGTAPLKVEFLNPDKEAVVCQETANGEDIARPRPLQLYEGIELVVRAVQLALSCRFKRIAVLATRDNELDARITAVLEANGLADQTTLLAYNAQLDREKSMQAGGFDLYDITMEQLHQARELMETEQAERVALLSCDQVQITPAHLLRLSCELDAHPEADLAAAWIMWLRRTPYLLSRKLLLECGNASWSTPGDTPGLRPLPALRCRDVVFGEERLAANSPGNKRAQRFFAHTKISARSAIELAHALASEIDDTQADSSESAPKPDCSAAQERYDALSHTEKAVVDIARMQLKDIHGKLSTGELEAAQRASDWGKRNELDFPLLTSAKNRGTLAYLDSAATSQRCSQALNAQAEFDTHCNANVYRGAYELSMQATNALNDARAALERFINSERRDTILAANASTACNLVAQAWGEPNIAENDLIVVSLAEHHSNLVPWVMLAQKKGARIAYLPVDGSGRYDLDAYAELLELKPKLICLAHISNVLGILNPIAQMAQSARNAGARVMLDATQSAPHVRLDVKQLGCDFVAFSAHKMYGPTGIGALWINPDAFDEMSPAQCGGGAISHVGIDSYYLREKAIQYEVGTPPIAQAVAWRAAIEYLEQLGMDAVEQHSRALTRYLVAGLQDIEGITICGDHNNPDGLTGLVSVMLPGIACFDLGVLCGKLGIAVRSGGHCALPLAASIACTGTARVSFGVHNTIEDVEAFTLAMELGRRLYSPWGDATLTQALNEDDENAR